MAETTLKQRASAFIMFNFQHSGIPGFVFVGAVSSTVNITSDTACGIPPVVRPFHVPCRRAWRCNLSEIEAVFSWNIVWYSDRTLLSSMRSVYVLPLQLPAVCRHGKPVSDCAIRKLLGIPRGLISLRQAKVGCEKNILYNWFSHITSTQTHLC